MPTKLKEDAIGKRLFILLIFETAVSETAVSKIKDKNIKVCTE